MYLKQFFFYFKTHFIFNQLYFKLYFYLIRVVYPFLNRILNTSHDILMEIIHKENFYKKEESIKKVDVDVGHKYYAFYEFNLELIFYFKRTSFTLNLPFILRNLFYY